MRKPSEYIAAAKAHLRDSLIPDCSEVMRHGERTAKVTRIGSPSIGGEPLMGDEPAESCRVLAMASDFPALARGEAVELGQTFRVVISCTSDIAGAGFKVGLSAAFERCPAVYSGTRRESGRVRSLHFPISALALETGSVGEYADAPAPALESSYTVALRRADWPEASGPEVSDSLRVRPDGRAEFNLNVAAVSRLDGWYVLKCRTRGGCNG
jgi:hypothetical protein